MEERKYLKNQPFYVLGEKKKKETLEKLSIVTGGCWWKGGFPGPLYEEPKKKTKKRKKKKEKYKGGKKKKVWWQNRKRNVKNRKKKGETRYIKGKELPGLSFAKGKRRTLGGGAVRKNMGKRDL